MKQIKGLDTVRAFAVLFVIISHWGPDLAPSTIGSFIKEVLLPDGHFGVTLFFVLSGFLITGILLKAVQNDTQGHKLKIIKNFFVRRALRIFPIYYLLLIILAIINQPHIRENMVYFATYTTNIMMYKRGTWNNPLSHTWSLAVEEQFYLILPWIIVFLNKKYIRAAIIIFILIGIGSSFYIFSVEKSPFNLLVFNCFDAFGLGGLYAYMRTRTNEVQCKKFEQRFKFIFFAALLWALSWNIAVYYGYNTALRDYMLRTITSIISVGIIMFVINNKSEGIRKYFLENRILNFLGRISYGLYLYHITVNYYYGFAVSKIMSHYPNLLPAMFNDFYFAFAMKLALLIIISSLSFTFFEQPILKLKDRFNYNE